MEHVLVNNNVKRTHNISHEGRVWATLRYLNELAVARAELHTKVGVVRRKRKFAVYDSQAQNSFPTETTSNMPSDSSEKAPPPPGGFKGRPAERQAVHGAPQRPYVCANTDDALVGNLWRRQYTTRHLGQGSRERKSAYLRQFWTAIRRRALYGSHVLHQLGLLSIPDLVEVG